MKESPGQIAPLNPKILKNDSILCKNRFEPLPEFDSLCGDFDTVDIDTYVCDTVAMILCKAWDFKKDRVQI